MQNWRRASSGICVGVWTWGEVREGMYRASVRVDAHNVDGGDLTDSEYYGRFWRPTIQNFRLVRSTDHTESPCRQSICAANFCHRS